MNRRHFLLAAAATAATARAAWARAGSPAFLAAAKTSDGDYVLCGLAEAGAALFRLPLPGRGHAAAARPTRPEAVAFARRPGDFALILDCAQGVETARLIAPKGRHFYGHGAFSTDGATLFTTENAFETGEGRIGVWDAADGYRRIDEFASGGVGPHDVLRYGDGLIVANGGIRTHPDYDREKLNIDAMRPNLTVIRAGAIVDQVEAPEALRKNSLRHLALREDGLIAVAAQWEGSRREIVPLLALWRPGEDLAFIDSPDGATMRGYAGSIAFADAGARVAITSPKGGAAQVFDAEARAHLATHRAPDLAGAAHGPGGAAFSAGDGRLYRLTEGALTPLSSAPLAWDNHLIALSA